MFPKEVKKMKNKSIVALIMKIAACVIWVGEIIIIAATLRFTRVITVTDVLGAADMFFGALVIGLVIFACGEIIALLHKLTKNML